MKIMKYLRTFENLSNDDDVKNEILLLDCSGSMSGILLKTIKNKDLYLSEKFTAILCASYDVIAMRDITLDELIDELKNGDINRNSSIGGGAQIQEGINYIISNDLISRHSGISNDLTGRILLIIDSFDNLDLRNLHNDISILCIGGFVFNPSITKNNFKSCQIFYEDLESLEQGFYLPRDITYANYELKANAKKYNI